MPGHISAYVDVVSPYSWFGSSYLISQRSKLLSHGITISIHPFFLGAVQVATKNVPPFATPAKAAYYGADAPRVAAHFGLQHRGNTPSFFPMKSLAAQRVLTVCKEIYDEAMFEQIMLLLFAAVWRDHRDLGQPDVLVEVLEWAFMKADVGGGWGHTTKREIQKVLKLIQEPRTKEALNATTARALELGAFGAPTFYAKRWEEGQSGESVKEEMFWGSDRFEFMFDYLGLPLQRMEILGKEDNTKGDVDARAKL